MSLQDDHRHTSSEPALSNVENAPKDSDREDANFLDSQGKIPKLRELRNSRPLSRSSYLLIPVFLYTFLIVFSWVVTCIMTHHPMTGNSYGVNVDLNKYYASGESQRYRYIANERWYTAVRFIQAGVAVLTIPLTTTVCSYAAVVYLQHAPSRSEPDITLRQMMSLADRGWTDLTLFTKLLISPSKNWKRYGSRFLAYAILLHILGGVISPLQQVYLSSISAKTPTAPYTMNDIGDVVNLFAGHDNGNFVGKKNRVALATRKAIEAVSADEMPSGLWTGSSTTCLAEGDTTYKWYNSNSTFKELCSRPGPTWTNISALPSPFMSLLPKDFNTGLVRQLAPRFNSSASYENTTAAEFRTGCATGDDSLSFKYSNVTDIDDETAIWALHACMPANSRSSTGRATRDRQDFTEELFLNVTLNTVMQRQASQWGIDYVSDGPESEYFRVEVRTTAGYFELPNYMNGQVAGPVLEKFDQGYCRIDCITQYYADLDSPEYPKRGPLSDTVIALFGEGSYLANQAKAPDLYVTPSKHDSWTDCVDLIPFGIFLRSLATSSSTNIDSSIVSSPVNTCVRGGVSEGADLQIGGFLSNFRGNNSLMEYAFTIAAYKANRIWLDLNREAQDWLISYDLGQDSQRPSISTKGVILLSTLLGLFLSLLWATTIYAIMIPRWADKLDSFTLMRLGASIHEKVPLRLAGNLDNIPSLDEMPGWIGDSTGHEKIGHVALGGPSELKPRKHFDAYPRPGVEKSLQEMTGTRERFWARQMELDRQMDRGLLLRVNDS